MTETRKPNFFIVGAPKCATTAMRDYLGQHPDIYFAAEKETHHFATDLIPEDDYWRPDDVYMGIFKGVGNEKVIGEASVFYLLSKRAARNIYDFNANSRILILIRNPVDMLYSYHSQLVFNGDENIKDFRSALEAEQERKEGRLIPSNIRFVERLFYSEVCSWSEQIERYLGLFGRERVKVVVYEDFREDPLASYRQVLDFLGVDSSFEPELRVVNPNKYIRSEALRKLLNTPPKLIHRISRILPERLRKAIVNRLRRMNVQYASRPSMPPELRMRLLGQYRPEVESLRRLLGMDLSRWDT